MKASTRYKLKALGWLAILLLALALLPIAANAQSSAGQLEMETSITRWAQEYVTENPGVSMFDAMRIVAARKLVVLDSILRSAPSVTVPDVIMISRTDGKITVGTMGPIMISIAGGVVRYEMSIGPWTFPDDGSCDTIAAGGIGAGIGLIAGIVGTLLLTR